MLAGSRPRVVDRYPDLRLRLTVTDRFVHFVEEEDQTATYDVNGPLDAGDGLALVAAAERAAGLVQAPDFMVDDAVEHGRLVEVLEPFAAPGPAIWALAAPHRHDTASIRAFVGLLRDCCSVGAY